jgi:hypothetical protein
VPALPVTPEDAAGVGIGSVASVLLLPGLPIR